MTQSKLLARKFLHKISNRIKLINRWNVSDDKLDRKFDALTKDVNSVDNQVSEVKGSLSRINGRH